MDDLEFFPLEENLDSLVAHNVKDLTTVLSAKHHADMDPVHVHTANKMQVYIQFSKRTVSLNVKTTGQFHSCLISVKSLSE